MREERPNKQRINVRPVLFCAVGLVTGIFLYAKIVFGGLVPSDFLFVSLLLLFALLPFGKLRTLAVLLCFVLSAGVGALSVHLYTAGFRSATESGEHRLTGTVLSVSVRVSYSLIVLGDLALDGEPCGGKCRMFCSRDDLCLADVVLCDATVKPIATEDFSDDAYTRNAFAENIRYTASASSVERVGRSKDPFLRLSAALFDRLHEGMGADEADLAFALLTGNSGGMDEGISAAARRGGVAHIFAVSGLHIGILYAAVYALFPFLKKSRFLPAIAASFLYCGLCDFTVSSVRAVIMCGVLGITRAFGKKYDFLDSISFAAFFTLLFLPQQWFSAGFRLSYGACLGLALFSAPFKRGLMRIRLPRFLADYFSAALAVQIFTFPVLLDAFGYAPAFALLFNLFLIPALPILFLGTLICAVLALIVPPAASVFLLLPQGMFTVFLSLLSVMENTLVIGGFALGAGSAVFLVGCVALSGRVRLSRGWKGAAACALGALFIVVVVFENVVVSGCRLDVLSRNGDTAALVRTPRESVLVIDGDISLSDCEDLLNRTYGGRLSAVVVLSEDGTEGANVAAFLPAERICLRDRCDTGLQNAPLEFGTRFSVGGLSFRFESRTKLIMVAEGCAVEFEFGEEQAIGADLFVGEEPLGTKYLKYFLQNAIIKTL